MSYILGVIFCTAINFNRVRYIIENELILVLFNILKTVEVTEVTNIVDIYCVIGLSIYTMKLSVGCRHLNIAI